MMEVKCFKTILILVLISVVPVAVSTAHEYDNSKKNGDPPNIILIMTDDQGFETIGAYGGESYDTPGIDKLAETGIRFDQAHANPVCTPSRVKMMSGRYNSRNYTGFGDMDPEIFTFGNLFQNAGYATFIGGKWQLSGDLSSPYEFGFDEYALWQVIRRGRGENPIANRYPNPGLAINGEIKNYFDGEYGPDIINDNVLDFIERHQEQPFFVYYPMNLPHFPFEPTPDSKDWDPTARRGDTEEAPGLGDTAYFGDMVEYVDKLVVKVVDHLDDLGLREKTLVIFTSDNGTHRQVTSIINGEEYKGGKLSSTAAGTHVPFIANWPGEIPQGVVNDDLISFTDFFPTLAEVAGIEVPQDLKLDGQSFASVLYGKDAILRDWLYMWWYRNNNPEGPGDEFARTHRYKYYQDGRFYDLSQDPLEEHSPIAKEELSAEQKALLNKLQNIIEENTREGFYQ
ncbi:MAG: sulfatase-like hydrolase/transferase [Balneolaceae bacterium]|nr:sulfatase-like hydrolase/transferase [Balneolaceae bacterium]MDR9417277.1 sulfatase-like hydrolase/transferase [Gracilimonas sp.]